MIGTPEGAAELVLLQDLFRKLAPHRKKLRASRTGLRTNSKRSP